VANGVIANAQGGRNRPRRRAVIRPINAPRRAGADSCSGVVRAREQRMLQHAARRRIDDERDAIDGGGRRMRFEIEQRERTQRPHVADRRGQLQAARARVVRDEAERHVQYGRAAIAPLEARGERLEQTREHERQRLESIDRPFNSIDDSKRSSGTSGTSGARRRRAR
jgi:hypothetical protein